MNPLIDKKPKYHYEAIVQYFLKFELNKNLLNYHFK